MMNRTLAAMSLLALGMSVGCSSKAPAGESQGQLELAVTSAPEDGTCLQVLVGGTRSEERDFDVKPGQSTVLALSGLPLGAVTVTVNAFAGQCAALTTTSVPTWVGDPVTTNLLRGIIGKIAITLVRNGRLSVSVDFNDPSTFFNPKCTECLKANCGAALKSGCDSLKDAALEGPAAGTSKAILCNETIACEVATHCGRSDLSACYCGAVPGSACTDDGEGNGPCRLVLDRSFEAVQPLDVPVRFTDASFAGGVAMTLLQCASDNCDGCL